MNPEDRLTPKQKDLYDLMSSISEDTHCAAWITGNEYYLWQKVVGHESDKEIGEERLAKLRGLSEEIGGWIVWLDDETNPATSLSDYGPYFVPLNVWKKLLLANSIVNWVEKDIDDYVDAWKRLIENEN